MTDIPYNHLKCIPSIPTVPYVLPDTERPYTVGLVVAVHEEFTFGVYPGNEVAFYSDVSSFVEYVEDGQTYYLVDFFEVAALRDLNETYSVTPEIQ